MTVSAEQRKELRERAAEAVNEYVRSILGPEATPLTGLSILNMVEILKLADGQLVRATQWLIENTACRKEVVFNNDVEPGPYSDGKHDFAKFVEANGFSKTGVFERSTTCLSVAEAVSVVKWLRTNLNLFG
jgi:hypothetical protein